MTSLLAGVGLLLVAGLICLVVSERWVRRIGPSAAVVAFFLGIVPTLQAVFGSLSQSVRWPWSMPYGSFAMGLDSLTGWFLLPMLAVGALAAIYGVEYLNSPEKHRPTGSAWFFYDTLLASMILLVLARNGMLFLLAWEIMSLSSFFLVMFEDDRPEVRQAGLTYLIATHVGTAFLLAMFVLAGHGAQDLDFVRFGSAAGSSAGILFVLAVVGFGTKAGFMPMHFWLPEAHPAAPSHVSAIMSGVMIKMGIYGLLRMLTLIGPPAAWWGWTLIGIGATSAILGIVFALAQQDLKRLLAYSSIENVGIITLAIGMGTLGASKGSAGLAALGYGGALLHVLNHSLFKSLLFLAAGAILHGTGTGRLEALGGLLKRMPWTGAAFFVGAAAICGLPPLNGFCGELLIYVGAFRPTATPDMGATIAGLCIVATLSLAGALALAAFVKAFGGCFLGEPRSPHAAHAHESNWAMKGPIVALAGGCILAAIVSPMLVNATGAITAQLSGRPASDLEDLAWLSSMLSRVVLTGLGFTGLVVLLAIARRRLLRSRRVEQTVTWDCGYAQPTTRMQYTASSLVQPLTALLAPVLRTRVSLQRPAGLFPAEASFSTNTPDVFEEQVFRPALGLGSRLGMRLRWLQNGHVQAYVLYIAVTLLGVLVWELW